MRMIKKYLKKDIYIYIKKKDKKLLIILTLSWYSSIIMEYQKIINLSDNTPNQPTRFKTKNWVEMIGNSRGTYNFNVKIKFTWL